MEQLFVVLAGICLFLYGMQLTKEGLQHKTGDRIRRYILTATRNTWFSLLLGMVGTFLLQSSTAAMAMLIGFTNTGLISLAQALAVALGAGIGTSLFVALLSQVLNFPIQGYAVLLLIIGLVMMHLRRSTSYTAKIIFGFGLVLLGLKMVATTGEWLTHHPYLIDQMMNMGQQQVATILITALVTMLLQSSTATLGILLSIALTGGVPLATALAVVLGANLGTTLAVLLVSLQGDEEGKRTVLGTVIFKLIMVLICLPFIGHLAEVLNLYFTSVASQIAMAHLLFNVVNALLAAPFLSLMARWLMHLIPAEIINEQQFQVKYLDKHVLGTPTLALGNVVREVLRMANITQDMFTQFITALENNRLDLVETLEATDDQVDILNREIKFYLARISQAELNEAQAKSQLELLSITTNLEELGDIINRNLCSLIRKKLRKQASFSAEGWKELRHFYQLILENFNLSISAFSTRNLEIAKKVARHKKNIHNVFEDLQMGHLNRLHEGLKESIATSSLHMELLSNMLRVNVLICKMINPILEGHDSSHFDS